MDTPSPRPRAVLVTAIAVAAVLCVAVVVAGAFFYLQARDEPGPPVAAPTAAGLTECVTKPQSDPDLDRPLPPPPTAAPVTGRVNLVLATNLGDIEIAIDRTKTPCTTMFLEFLAGNGFYNDTSCHRLTTVGIYVLQCGDPTGTGMGGPGWGYAEENLSRRAGSRQSSESPLTYYQTIVSVLVTAMTATTAALMNPPMYGLFVTR